MAHSLFVIFVLTAVVCANVESASEKRVDSGGTQTRAQTPISSLLRSLTLGSSSMKSASREVGERRGEGERREQEAEREEKREGRRWVYDLVQEVTSLAIVIAKAPIQNQLARSSLDTFRELPPHWESTDERNDEINEESDTLWNAVVTPYVTFFRSMNLARGIDRILGKAISHYIEITDNEIGRKVDQEVNGNSGESIVQRYEEWLSQDRRGSLFSSFGDREILGSPHLRSDTFHPSQMQSIGKRSIEFEESLLARADTDTPFLRCNGIGAVVTVQDDNSTGSDEGVCACPLDYMGKDCEKFRPFVCVFSLTDPKKDCLPMEYRTGDEGEPVCLLYSLSDIVTFSYSIDCSFLPSETVNETLYLNHPDFAYSVRKENDTFAVSLRRKERWIVDQKIYNFNRFSDNQQLQGMTATSEHLSGSKVISFVTNFSAVDPKKYIFGGRLYLEAAMTRQTKIRGLQRNVPARVYVDFNDTSTPSSSEDYLALGYQRFMLLYFAFGVCGLLLLMYCLGQLKEWAFGDEKDD